MSSSEIQAATTIQHYLRNHWASEKRIFPSQRLEVINANVEHSLLNRGIMPLRMGSDRPFLPMGKQAILPLIDGASPEPKIAGFGRLPFTKQDCTFEEEAAVASILSQLGLTAAVYQGKRTTTTVSHGQFFLVLKNAIDVSEMAPEHPLQRFFACENLSEVLELVQTFDTDQRALCRMPVDNPFEKLYFYYVNNFIEALFKMADREKQDGSLQIPLLLFTGPETSGHSQEAFERIPAATRDTLTSIIGETYVGPEFMGGDVFPRCIGTISPPERDELCRLVTTYSFEQLLAVAYLLGLPDLSHEQLSCYLTPHGKLHLYLFSSQLKIFRATRIDENWLTNLPHMDQEVSRNFRIQVQQWSSEGQPPFPSTLSEEKCSLLQYRIERLSNLLSASDSLTWREVMEDLRPDWTENAKVTEVVRQKLRFTVHTVEEAVAEPDEGYVDLLHWKPSVRRMKWRLYQQRLKEVERVVLEVMPRVTQIVDLWQTNYFPEIKKAFVKVEDRGDPRKFIGQMCCGVSTAVTSILLRANGVQAYPSGSTLRDHAFVRIPTPYHMDIFVDPTYKQLFPRSESELASYWHQLPPALVGSPRDFRDFYKKHKSLPRTIWEHHWVYADLQELPTESSHRYGDVYQWQVSGVCDSPGHSPTANLIKRFLTEEETQTLVKTAPVPVERKIQALDSDISPERAVELLRAYVRRILYHGTPLQLQSYAERPLSDTIPSCYELADVATLYAVLLRNIGFDVHWFSVEALAFLEITTQDGQAYFIFCPHHPSESTLSTIQAKPMAELENVVRAAFLASHQVVAQDWSLPDKNYVPDMNIQDMERALEDPLFYKELPNGLKRIVNGIAKEATLRVCTSD